MKITFLDGSSKEFSCLRRANLMGANLPCADLKGADLFEAELTEADLLGANLDGANLRGASLNGANLRWAKLRGANLQGADLRKANLRGANLSGADVTDIKVNYLTEGFLPSCPEGDIIGWKIIDGVIVKVLVPADAERSSATTRKCRCSKAKVLEIEGERDKIISVRIFGGVRVATLYRKGEYVYPDSWDADRWNECSHGIHFFLTKAEAEGW